MHIFHVMPKEHQPRLLEELVTSSISRLNNASQTCSTLKSNVFSPSQMRNVSDDIMLLSGLSKEFTLVTSSDEDMEDNDKAPAPKNATDLVMTSHIVSLIRSTLPAILFLTESFLHDEVSVCSIIQYLIICISISSGFVGNCFRSQNISFRSDSHFIEMRRI